MRPIFTLFVTLTLTLPISAQAISTNGEMQQHMIQQLQHMTPEEREAIVSGMMKNAQAIESCVNEAGGEETLEDLQIIGEAHRQQVKNLCESGKYKAAQAYAHDAASEIKKDPRVEKLRNCSRMALQNMPQLSKLMETGGIDTSKPVCG